MRIRLIIGNQQASATPEGDPATRDLVSLLPVTIPMRDLFGREKPGPLPQALTGDVEPVFTYQVGQIAYWPPNHDIFIVYAGNGLGPQPGPHPAGHRRLGHTGLEPLSLTVGRGRSAAVVPCWDLGSGPSGPATACPGDGDRREVRGRAFLCE
jgi:hypothetical protein